MHASSLALFAFALAGACALPGPATTAVVARTLSHGWSGALPLCVGLLLGDLVWCALSMFGAARLLAQSQPVALGLRYAGAAYLAWLAWKLLRTTPDGNEAGEDDVSTLSGGLAIALANPKTMLFYLALLPTIVDVGRVSLRESATVALVIVAVVGSVLIAYALAATAACRRFGSAVHALRARRVSGAVIALTAVLIVLH